MYQKAAVIILLLSCSIVSTGLFFLLKFILLKGKGGQKYKELYFVFSFYMAGYLFLLSAVKYYLGYHKENILESFWDLQMATLLHYGIPLLIIGIGAPFVLHFLFRGKDGNIIKYFDSSLFFTLAFTFFFVRKLNNAAYCMAFLAALVMTLLAMFILKKKDAVYVRETDLKKCALMALPVMLYWLVTIVLYIPNELYLNNAADFPMSYWYFFGKLFLGGILVFAVLFAGLLIYLSKGQYTLFLTLVFAMLTMGYVQGMFLNGNMGILDGTLQTWIVSKMMLNLVIWFIGIGGIVAFRVWKKEQADKLLRVVSIWLILTQLVSLGVLIISSDETAPKSEMALTTEGMLEVSAGKNILVFVLDKFDGRVMDEILEEDPEFLLPLQDFTYYQNVTSEFSPTYNSIPFLLSGTALQEDSTEDYVSYAYRGDNLLRLADAAGYAIGVYTNKRYVSEELQGIVSNYAENVQRTCNMQELFSLMTQCSRYKLSPFAAKNYYMYDTSDIELLVVNEQITNIENDLPFYNRLIQEGLSVSDKNAQGNFRFIHMHGAHPPYTMTEEFQYLEYDARRDEHWGSGLSQARGAMKIVYEYIRQLKELEKYDDAMIVITSDHGYTNELSDSEGNMVDITYPILFVKEPYDTNEEIQNSQAPVCHADLIMTMQKMLGYTDIGETLKEIEDMDRIRFLTVANPGYIGKYQIQGDVRQMENWKYLYSMNMQNQVTH